MAESEVTNLKMVEKTSRIHDNLMNRIKNSDWIDD